MKKWSEEELWKAYKALNFRGVRDEYKGDLGVMSDAITELLTLRRRLEDKDAIAEIIREKRVEKYSLVADAIIKYLTEGTDGE